VITIPAAKLGRAGEDCEKSLFSSLGTLKNAANDPPRMPSARAATETARYMRAVGRRPRAIKWLANSAAINLPLAAHPCVGHIGLNGAVAEWLKAAVC
jgi:hypothetical protein